MNTIQDNTLKALGFHISSLGYLEEREPRFVDVTDKPDFIIETVDNSQPITDFENEKVRKQNKRVAKRKRQLDNLCVSIHAFAASFATLLLSHCAYIYCFISFTPLLSYFRSFI